MKAFSARLRERAKALGLSSSDVARKLGLSERRYSHYVTGAREPDLAMLVSIAKALGTTPDQLLGVTEESDDNPKRHKVVKRLIAVMDVLPEAELESLSVQVEALARRQFRKDARPARK